MNLRHRLTITLAATCLFAAQPILLADTKPIPVEVYVRGEKRDTKISGKLVSFDEAGVTLDTATGKQALDWDQLTPTSAFTLKSRLIDKENAADWLALGTWGWQRNLVQQSRAAFASARKLDATLGTQIDAILATEPGQLLARSSATTRPAVTQPAETKVAPPTSPPKKNRRGIIVYTTPTTQQVDAAMADARRDAQKMRDKLGIDLKELETAHFLIFTDWDAREYGFLKEKCEGAYRVVSKQFAMKEADNVFVGKLPIYMFKRAEDFRRFASTMDEFAAPETVLGYYHSQGEMGHMAMWKPGIGVGIGAGGSLDEAIRNWGRTLVHEFTHAFIHRYKSSAQIPRWLNEGTAELISEGELPTNNYRANARQAAQQNVDLSSLYDDANMPSGYYYPIMMTMAECLVKQDGKKFIALFDDIKSGTEPETALKNAYGLSYEQLSAKWKTYAKGLR